MSGGKEAGKNAVALQIGKNLRRCLSNSNRSAEEATRTAEMHRTHLRMIKNGERLPQVDTIIRIAAAIDVDPAELLRGISWNPSTKAFYIDGKRAPS